jgi:hypothetical protein
LAFGGGAIVDRRFRFPQQRLGKAEISLGTNPLSRTSKQDANAACKASALDGLLADAGVEQDRGPFVPRLPPGALRLAYQASSPSNSVEGDGVEGNGG